MNDFRFCHHDKIWNTQQPPTPQNRQAPPPQNSRVTFKLDDEPVDKNLRTRNTFNDQYENNTKRDNNQADELFENDEMRSIMEERKKRLRGLSMKLTSADLNELEKEPAYKRRNVDLDDVPHSSESNVSKYSLYEEEKNKPEIKQKRNPFLHDNVD